MKTCFVVVCFAVIFIARPSGAEESFSGLEATLRFGERQEEFFLKKSEGVWILVHQTRSQKKQTQISAEDVNYLIMRLEALPAGRRTAECSDSRVRIQIYREGSPPKEKSDCYGPGFKNSIESTKFVELLRMAGA